MIAVGGLIAFYAYVQWSRAKRRAYYARQGVEPDYSAWETRIARKTAFFAIGGMAFIGLVVIALGVVVVLR